MERREVMAKLIKIIENIKQVKYDSQSIGEESYLGGDLGVHSVEMLEAMFDVQRDFRVVIDDKEFVNLYTIKDVMDMIMRNLGGGTQ
jgi:acyl carrier protein